MLREPLSNQYRERNRGTQITAPNDNKSKPQRLLNVIKITEHMSRIKNIIVCIFHTRSVMYFLLF